MEQCNTVNIHTKKNRGQAIEEVLPTFIDSWGKEYPLNPITEARFIDAMQWRGFNVRASCKDGSTYSFYFTGGGDDVVERNLILQSARFIDKFSKRKGSFARWFVFYDKSGNYIGVDTLQFLQVISLEEARVRVNKTYYGYNPYLLADLPQGFVFGQAKMFIQRQPSMITLPEPQASLEDIHY